MRSCGRRVRDIVAADMFALATAVFRATVVAQIEQAVRNTPGGPSTASRNPRRNSVTNEDLSTRDWYD
jgi:hypothetical protein